MAFDFNLTQYFWSIVQGILVKAPEIIIVIYIIKHIPQWLEQYFKLREKQLVLERALGKKI